MFEAFFFSKEEVAKDDCERDAEPFYRDDVRDQREFYRGHLEYNGDAAYSSEQGQRFPFLFYFSTPFTGFSDHHGQHEE